MNFQNNNNFDNLINQAGKASGINPKNLKQTIDNGKLDDLLKKMNPKDAEKFIQIVQNPSLAQQMLNTPKAQMLIKKFMKK